MADVIRTRRQELGLSQAQLASSAGVGTRQIRRYEAGEQQPVLSVAVAIADALEISIEELAGQPSQRVDLTGDWWCCWQTYKDGTEVINAHQVSCQQHAEMIEIVATTRGTDTAGGGYLWRGELRLWDNEVLMGWYTAAEGATRSKGTIYFSLHPHGLSARGRWVGLSYDGPIITGWGAMAKTEDEVRRIMDELRDLPGMVRA